MTLIELMVATVIIGVLAMGAGPTVQAYAEQARVAKGVQIGRVMQAALAASTMIRDRDQYPTAIDSYSDLIAIVNAHGASLPDTETQAGMVFRSYTPLDTDGDDTWDRYTMSFIVSTVTTKRSGCA